MIARADLPRHHGSRRRTLRAFSGLPVGRHSFANRWAFTLAFGSHSPSDSCLPTPRLLRARCQSVPASSVNVSSCTSIHMGVAAVSASQSVTVFRSRVSVSKFGSAPALALLRLGAFSMLSHSKRKKEKTRSATQTWGLYRNTGYWKRIGPGRGPSPIVIDVCHYFGLWTGSQLGFLSSISGR